MKEEQGIMQNMRWKNKKKQKLKNTAGKVMLQVQPRQKGRNVVSKRGRRDGGTQN